MALCKNIILKASSLFVLDYLFLNKKTNIRKAVKELTLIDEIIVNKIYYIRKQRIMLDRDLAELIWSTSDQVEGAGKKKY
jgi:hypothetical protein